MRLKQLFATVVLATSMMGDVVTAQEVSPSELQAMQDKGLIGPGSIQAVITETGDIEYYFVPFAEDVTQDPGTTAQVQPPDWNFDWQDTYGVFNAAGKTVGVLYSEASSADLMSGAIEDTGLMVRKVRYRRPAGSVVKVKSGEWLKKVGITLRNHLTAVVCESGILPIQAEASASAGIVSFSVTWETNTLCNDG